MRRVGAVLIIALFCGSYGLAQSGRTRPRVAASPTPTPIEVSSDDTGYTISNPARKAPVLLGGTKTPSPTPTPESSTDGEDDIIRIETNIVTMPVSVLDRDGRFISGLDKRDFQIFEDGVRQQIGYFESVETPFTVVLMLDVSPSTRFKIEEIQDAAMQFIDELRENDRVMVVSFDEKVHILCQPTNNRSTLYNAVHQTKFGGGTSLYDSIDNVIANQLRRIDGRKAVVLFTDGVDTTSKRSNYQISLRNAEETEALFYPIRYDTIADMNGGSGGGYPRGGGTSNVNIGTILGILLGGGVQSPRSGGGNPGGRSGSSNSEYETGRRYLEELANASGGRSFEAGYDLYGAFTGIAEELRRQYFVGYYPEKSGQPGDRRQIRIRVMRPNLVVRAKTSYIVGAGTSSVAGK